MKLPTSSVERIFIALTSKSLLVESAATEVVQFLEKEQTVNWNLVLSKQFESEQGGRDEAES